MAKKDSKVGKAAAIRDFVRDNPKIGPQETAKVLSEQGIKVSAAYVSTIKSLAKKRKRKAGRKAAAAAPAASKDAVSISVLMQAKKLAAQLGGVSQAKAALDALAKLGV